MYKYLITLSYILLLSLSQMTLAHDWYDPACCSQHDCKPVPCESIKATIGGFTHRELFFPLSSVKASQDQQCHACVSEGVNLVPHCLYLPGTS